MNEPSKHATVHTLAEMQADFPMPLLSRRRIMGEKMMLSHVLLEQGFTLAPHSHENEQFVIMVKGFARFAVGQPGSERTIDLRDGQVLVLPPWVPHGVEALEACEILDFFSPVSATTGIDKK